MGDGPPDFGGGVLLDEAVAGPVTQQLRSGLNGAHGGVDAELGQVAVRQPPGAGIDDRHQIAQTPVGVASRLAPAVLAS